MLYGGQGVTYAVRLTEKYGAGTVEELEAHRWKSVKLDQAWYEEQIAVYQEKLAELSTAELGGPL